jgi:hypothetical protein
MVKKRMKNPEPKKKGKQSRGKVRERIRKVWKKAG